MSSNFIKIYEQDFDPEVHVGNFIRSLELAYISGSEYRYVNGVCMISGDIPDESANTYIPISAEVVVSAGYCASLSRLDNGNPVLTLYGMHNLPISEVRLRRNIEIQRHEWMVSRHISQLSLPEVSPTLSSVQYTELLAYLQALRDLPQTADLTNIVWPTKPSFI